MNLKKSRPLRRSKHPHIDIAVNRGTSIVGLRRFYIAILISFPVLVFYFVINYFAVNVPFQDDFDGLLEPTIALHKRPLSFSKFIDILYTQDDERRIVMNRIVAYAISLIFGHLDLTKQMLAGASTLLVLLMVLFGWFRAHAIDLKYFVAIPFVLFNLRFFDAIFWANIPVQQVGVLVWAITSLYFLTVKQERTQWFGIFFALLSLFSDVSGALVFPIGILILVLRKNWKLLIGWVAILGLATFFYFVDLKIPAYRPSLASNLAEPHKVIAMYLTMHGLWLDPSRQFGFSIRQVFTFIMGVITFIWFLKVLITKVTALSNQQRESDSGEAFVFGSLLFFTSIFLVFVLGRASEGFGSIYITRYQLIYILWAIFCYMLILLVYREKIEKFKQFSPLILAAAVIYYLAGYFHFWSDTDYFRKVLLVDAYEWKQNRIIPSSPIYLSEKEDVDRIYTEAYETGIYRGEQYPFAKLFESVSVGNTHMEVEDGEYFMRIRFPDLPRGSGRDEGVYLLLESENERHIFPTRNNARSLIQAVKSMKYYYSGAESIGILKTYLHSGQYKVFAGVIDGKKLYKYEVEEDLFLRRE